ncbi:MAG TPA: flagellar basal body protein [Acidocella sp.]|jgi:flagellar basal-body rod protein FlgB|uniref:flagellar basal body rod protein FlgB n=1 Tax=Acidocella sp. TaxID=50710 RepID=UPI002C90FCC1|nr:flagellar basal body protein [Acidocella sp.]HVE21989.1 flagellar basal body protein [Acidocella sp.]
MQIGFLNLYGGVLNVRQERASLIADNIANADTPGYKAQDVQFQQALAAQLGDGPASGSAPLFRASDTVSLDGNDVSMDSERVEAAQNADQTEAAATFLHQSTADLITALHPNPAGN